ncbi:diguanylate cyclase [Proteobacteria bacterium 005FR1]|nr:diguanylate cyclase [Proteobacteria bacterium 005FR1]
MTESPQFLHSVLDSISAHIAVIDQRGLIVFTNQSWRDFARQNDCTDCGHWLGVDYLSVCQQAMAAGDDYAAEAVRGIAEVIERVRESFQLEYPCHSPDRKRWFIMRASSFMLDGQPYFVLAHEDITERKIAEQRVLDLARVDGLTGVYNRRYFDEFLEKEWRRCCRQGQPISLALLDIDHFKLLNDHYGHQYGDDCLRQVGEVLNRFGRRAGDLCARYGGEEFALVFGSTPLEGALAVVRQIVAAIEALRAANEVSPTRPVMTVSVGLAALYPRRGLKPAALIEAADRLLYRAKETGRDRVVCEHE